MDESEVLHAILRRTYAYRAHERFGAHSIGIGNKRVGGKFTDKTALVFVVPCKVSASALPREQRVPPEIRFIHPTTGEEAVATTDVVAFPSPELHSLPPGATHRPVPGGVRCTRVTTGDDGTLGGWVWDKTDDSIVFLSNQHVIGDVVGDPVEQGTTGTLPPGKTLRIGEVKRAAGLITVNGSPPYPESQCNYADAAIGSVDHTEDISLTVLEVGPAVYETKQVSRFQNVEKFGQITGHQEGLVTLYPVATTYEFSGIGDCGICDAFQVEPVDPNGEWSSMGDSGGLIFERDPSATIKPCIGLHFAGGGTAAAGNNYGVACRIEHVFDALDLDVLCGGGFAAFLDALFADGSEDGTVTEAVSLLKPRELTPPFYHGMSRAVQARLKATPRGRVVTDAVQAVRAELMELMVSSGDARRAAAHALRPILKGAVTVDRLFERRLDAEDVARLTLMLDTFERHGTTEMRGTVRALRDFVRKADGKSPSELL